MTVPNEMLHRIARVVMGIQRAIERGYASDEVHKDYIALLKHANNKVGLSLESWKLRHDRVRFTLNHAGGDYLGDGTSLIADFEASVSWLAS